MIGVTPGNTAWISRRIERHLVSIYWVVTFVAICFANDTYVSRLAAVSKNLNGTM